MERETAAEAANNEQVSQAESAVDILAIPVWLHATDSF